MNAVINAMGDWILLIPLVAFVGFWKWLGAGGPFRSEIKAMENQMGNGTALISEDDLEIHTQSVAEYEMKGNGKPIENVDISNPMYEC